MRKLLIGLVSFELLVAGATACSDQEPALPTPLDIFGEPIISPDTPNCSEELVEAFLDDWAEHMAEEDEVVGLQNSDSIIQGAGDMADAACEEAPDSVARLTLGMRPWECHTFTGRTAVLLTVLGSTAQGKFPYTASQHPAASFGPIPLPEPGEC